VNYRYDYLNRLVSRTVDQTDLTDNRITAPTVAPTSPDNLTIPQPIQSTHTVEHIIHDGNQIALQFENNELAQRNFWGAETDELIAVDNLIDEETLWILADHLNSTRNILRNENNNVETIASINYDAFGNIAEDENTINYAYTGKYHDNITGLQWNINRWYDSTTGQWISEDPIGFSGGDTNLRRYVGNDPIDKIDSNGLEWWNDSLFDYVDPRSWYGWLNNRWSNLTNCMNATERFNDQRARELNDISNGGGDASRALNTEIPTEVIETTTILAETGVTVGGVASGFGSGVIGRNGITTTCTTGNARRIVSRIHESKNLVKEAEKVGRSVQKDIDNLVAMLEKGNMSPGTHTKHLFNGIFEARTDKGARVYFRNVGDTIEILAKSDKNNQDKVIDAIQKMYGK
jgi:RHS repeat-associated protein